MTFLPTFRVSFVLIVEQENRLHRSLRPLEHAGHTRYPSPQKTPTLKQYHDEVKALRIPNLSFIESESLEILFLEPGTHIPDFTWIMA